MYKFIANLYPTQCNYSYVTVRMYKQLLIRNHTHELLTLTPKIIISSTPCITAHKGLV